MIEIAAFPRRNPVNQLFFMKDVFTESIVETTETDEPLCAPQRRLIKKKYLRDRNRAREQQDAPSDISRTISSVQEGYRTTKRSSWRQSSIVSDSLTFSPHQRSSNALLTGPPLSDDDSPEPPVDGMSSDRMNKKTSFRNSLPDKTGQVDIDINAAVDLLQELSRRASPQELVALHRALLPKLPDEHAVVAPAAPSYSRRASALLPGKGTRGKSPCKSAREHHISNLIDLVTPSKRRSNSEAQHGGNGNLGVAQLSALPAHNGVPTFHRSYSPMDLNISSIGGLQLGSLKVVNGVASAASSVCSGHEENPFEVQSASDERAGEADDIEDAPGADDLTPTAERSCPWAGSVHLASEVHAIPNLPAGPDDKDENLGKPSNEATISRSCVYSNEHFNASSNSFVSRLSTIQDDESILERCGTPADALDRLNGEGLSPRSNRSSTSGMSTKRHSTSDTRRNTRTDDKVGVPISTDLDERVATPSTPAEVPAVSDEMSVNFSRRISRAPGSYHRERAIAAHAHGFTGSPANDHGNPSPYDGELHLSSAISASPAKNSPLGITGLDEAEQARPEVQKKRSRFRLRGRSRSKSMSRPETNLPQERRTPTVQDTVRQWSSPMPESAVPSRLTPKSTAPFAAATGMPSSAVPDASTKMLAKDKWEPFTPTTNTKDAHERSRSMPRTDATSTNRQSTEARSFADKGASSHQRSRSTAPVGARRPLDTYSIAESLPPLESMVIATSVGADMTTPRRGNRRTISQIFSRSTSAERSGRSSSKPRKQLDVSNPAFIAAQMPSPPPSPSPHAAIRIETPRTNARQLPWDTAVDLTAAVKLAAEPTRSTAAQRSPQPPSRAAPTTPQTAQTNRPHLHGREWNSATKAAPPQASDASTAARPKVQARSRSSTTTTPLGSLDPNVRTRPSQDDMSYRAYRAADAVSMTKLTSPAKLVRTRGTSPSKPASARPQNEARKSGPSHARNDSVVAVAQTKVMDRFSGGLEYGWEREAGFQSSAGLRGEESRGAQRKSGPWSEMYGVDLSDVPVFLQK